MSESGRTMELRSTSSDHGRRWDNPWRMEDESRERKARKAGVAIGDGDDCEGFDIGSVGGEAIGWLVARARWRIARETLLLKRGG